MFSQRLSAFKSFPLSNSSRNSIRLGPSLETRTLLNRWYSSNQPLHRKPVEEDTIPPKDNASRETTTDSEANVRSDWDNTPIDELERETAAKSQRTENVSVNDRKSPPSADEM
ncbi:Schizosaccharomyces specific protein [Schizosaccharomyces osmophilus]|uniref:Schizosaccharomyces specific protein n=1 Tax=Schizosaccharomyces osmophilus TaxID=2545709 RepID=A0AAE9WGT3_9SCHI|nr:Schizosaccharomyces specific protein [Schizosaccharomyces osmophilus]WBW74877.1 Schizosaccharomyces specific protein [Schizosaccharomyces osmophilus]